jgi:multiple sugar transport system permease protein
MAVAATTVQTPAAASAAPRFLRGLGRAWLLVLAAAFVGWCLFPFYIMLTTALKTEHDIFAWPPIWVFEPQFQNLQQALFVVGGRSALSFAINSVIITALSTLLALVFGALAAYGLARFRFRGSKDIAFFILSTRFAPPVAFVIPVYVLVQKVGLLDSHLALIIVYAAANISFVTWILRGFFAEIPPEIEEAARVDGYSHWQIFWRVALPLVRPGLVTTAILTAIFSWNEFLYAMILTRTKSSTLPVYLSQFSGSTNLIWDQYMAVGVLAVLPILLVAIWLQDHLVRGLTFGAVR